MDKVSGDPEWSEIMQNIRLLTILFFILFNGISYCQSLWLTDTDKNSVSMEYFRPVFNNRIEGIEGFAIFITSRWGIAPKHRAVMEIPYTYNKYYDHYRHILGNIYMGYELWPQGNFKAIEAGLRFLLGERQDEGLIGPLSEVDRISAYQDEWFVLQLAGNAYPFKSENYFARIRIAPSIWKDFGGAYKRTTEAFLDYSLQLWLLSEVDIEILIKGSLYLTEVYASFGEISETQLGFGFVYKTRRLNLGANIQIPLEKSLIDYIDYTTGVNLQFKIPK